jgi:hypothetical protein
MDPGLLGTGLLTAFAVREVLQSRVRSRRVAESVLRWAIRRLYAGGVSAETPRRPVSPLRGRKKVPRVVREREMLEVAGRVFAQRGFHAASMDQSQRTRVRRRRPDRPRLPCATGADARRVPGAASVVAPDRLAWIARRRTSATRRGGNLGLSRHRCGQCHGEWCSCGRWRVIGPQVSITSACAALAE